MEAESEENRDCSRYQKDNDREFFISLKAGILERSGWSRDYCVPRQSLTGSRGEEERARWNTFGETVSCLEIFTSRSTLFSSDGLIGRLLICVSLKIYMILDYFENDCLTRDNAVEEKWPSFAV